jgi:hypothetical protein
LAAVHGDNPWKGGWGVRFVVGSVRGMSLGPAVRPTHFVRPFQENGIPSAMPPSDAPLSLDRVNSYAENVRGPLVRVPSPAVVQDPSLLPPDAPPSPSHIRYHPRGGGGRRTLPRLSNAPRRCRMHG